MDNYSKVNQQAFTYRFVNKIFVSIIGSLFLSPILGVVIGSVSNSLSTITFAFAFVIVFVLFLLFEGFLISLEAKNLGYKIEDNALLFRQGVFNISKITIPFARITNSSFDQSLFQRMFSVGNITIDQEDSSFVWKGIDGLTADSILKAVSTKSNIQPIQSSKQK